jgi:hypothetical protein
MKMMRVRVSKMKIKNETTLMKGKNNIKIEGLDLQGSS